MKTDTTSKAVYVFLAAMLCLFFLPSNAISSPDSNTKLLLHLEGAHGSTTFTDSTSRHNFTHSGGVAGKISTVNFKYGTASVFHNAATDSAFTETSGSNMNDYRFELVSAATAEMWINLTNKNKLQYICAFGARAAMGVDSSNRVFIKNTVDPPYYTIQTDIDAISTTSTWHHLAFVKVGTDTTIYVDGSPKVTGTTPVWYVSPSSNTYCFGWRGAAPNEGPFDGFVDEVRFSNINRYSGTFTPPSNGYVGTLDIKFYYTGTGTTAWPNSSLGGTQSSNEITDMQHCLFDWVTTEEATAGDTEYRAIDIKNDSPTDNIQSAVVWLNNQASYSTMSIAHDGTATQSVATESTAPSGLTWSTGTTRSTGVSLGNMGVGTKKRLWFKREIPAGATKGTDNVTIRVEGYAP